MGSRDQLFAHFARGLFAILLLYGAAMIAMFVFGSETIGVKMLNVFASMFTGVLGLGSGYLLGKNGSK